ncbi:MAG: 2-dehydropantoate 2-reductase N-terminal domain-containing protein, partial [Candidatus Poribacteria bacterium]
MKITVYGAGTFGFVLARHLGRKFVNNKKYKIWLYGRNPELMETIQATRTHPVHFPNVALPENVLATSERDIAVNNSQLIILATPAQSVRSAIRDIRQHINQNITILSAAKGLELETNLRLSEVINQELAGPALEGIKYKYKVAVFSGGTIASEMIMDAALGAEIGCEDYKTAQFLQELMSNQHLRVYANTDIIGVEYSGAL